MSVGLKKIIFYSVPDISHFTKVAGGAAKTAAFTKQIKRTHYPFEICRTIIIVIPNTHFSLFSIYTIFFSFCQIFFKNPQRSKNKHKEKRRNLKRALLAYSQLLNLLTSHLLSFFSSPLPRFSVSRLPTENGRPSGS